MIMAIGIFGASLILLAFLMNQVGKWKNDDLIYDFVNFLGALLLVVYGLLIGSYPFVVLNVVWTVFSFRDIIIDIKNGKSKNK
jgi:hypothetical protein